MNSTIPIRQISLARKFKRLLCNFVSTYLLLLQYEENYMYRLIARQKSQLTGNRKSAREKVLYEMQNLLSYRLTLNGKLWKLKTAIGYILN